MVRMECLGCRGQKRLRLGRKYLDTVIDRLSATQPLQDSRSVLFYIIAQLLIAITLISIEHIFIRNSYMFYMVLISCLFKRVQCFTEMRFLCESAAKECTGCFRKTDRFHLCLNCPVLRLEMYSFHYF